MTNPKPEALTREALDGMKRFVDATPWLHSEHWSRLIATLEAAWAENERLRAALSQAVDDLEDLATCEVEYEDGLEMYHRALEALEKKP